MKIGDYKLGNYAAGSLQNDKKAQQQAEATISSNGQKEYFSPKNASFVGDIKALNETVAGLELVGNSMQKISGDKMEEAVKDLRNITNNLKGILAKNFENTNAKQDDYSVEALKVKLQGTNPTNLHNFDYLASKAADLLA